MLDSQRFPPDALEIRKQVRWRPDARIGYEGLSGGLVWSDEFPREAVDVCVHNNSWAFRLVIGYRASLTRGKPREETRHDPDLPICPLPPL